MICAIWKGIVIASAVPFVLISTVNLTKWRWESIFRYAAALKPYQRLLWLDFVVLVVALVIVVTHCVD